MKKKILLNGVGRIGKAILRILLNNEHMEVVAINEINPNIESIAYSINYDSTYGALEDKFKASKQEIKNSKKSIKIHNAPTLWSLDMQEIDIIIDASGSKPNIERLKQLMVEAIIITHPSNKADVNVVLGVNENELHQNHKIISTSSCNATALLPILKIIEDSYGIECGDITTIHPLLNHQRVLDSGCIGSVARGVECNLEFGRSATQNIIPSQTTTIEACSFVLPNINESLIASCSLRVPTATVGAISVTLWLHQNTTLESIKERLHRYAQAQSFDILRNNYEPLVSSDFQQERFTTIVDHRFTQLKKEKMLKLLLWYDNEWGYANKVVDIVQYLCTHLSSKGSKLYQQ